MSTDCDAVLTVSASCSFRQSRIICSARGQCRTASYCSSCRNLQQHHPTVITRASIHHNIAATANTSYACQLSLAIPPCTGYITPPSSHVPVYMTTLLPQQIIVTHVNSAWPSLHA